MSEKRYKVTLTFSIDEDVHFMDEEEVKEIIKKFACGATDAQDIAVFDTVQNKEISVRSVVSVNLSKKKIFLAHFGDTDFFFNEEMKSIGIWDNNEVEYRQAYIGDLFNELGFEVIQINPAQAEKLIQEYFEEKGHWNYYKLHMSRLKDELEEKRQFNEVIKKMIKEDE